TGTPVPTSTPTNTPTGTPVSTNTPTIVYTPTATPTRIELPPAGVFFPSQFLIILGSIVALGGLLFLF
ncbi:MAG: glycoside hydrolase, partial [Patescibacteria group bacterium]